MLGNALKSTKRWNLAAQTDEPMAIARDTTMMPSESRSDAINLRAKQAWAKFN